MNINLKVLGDNIRRSRLSRQMAQQELANKCGLCRGFVGDTERGTRNLSYLSLLKLAQGLGTTVSDLTYNLEFLARLPLEATTVKRRRR
jgi:transcriptional regulator with XRE-family HTH domain